jgi:hypothetical protein
VGNKKEGWRVSLCEVVIPNTFATIQDRRQQAVASNTLATMIASTDKLEQVLHFIQRSWRQAVTRDEALTLFSGAITVIPRISDIGTAFQSAFSWVDNFLKGKNDTKENICLNSK